MDEEGINQVAGGVFLSLKEMVTARNLGRAKLDEEGMNKVAGGASGAQLRPLPWNRLNIVQNHAFWSLSAVILELLENFGLGAPWTCNAVLKLDREKMSQVAPDRCPASWGGQVGWVENEPSSSGSSILGWSSWMGREFRPPSKLNSDLAFFIRLERNVEKA